MNGQTVAESFASPAAFHKAQAEIHQHQRLQKLCGDLVDVNERICRLRPIEKQPEKWSAEKKAVTAIHQEVASEIDTLLPRIFADRRKTGRTGYGSRGVSLAPRAPHRWSRQPKRLLRQPEPVHMGVRCSCGGRPRYKDMRLKPVLTLLGPAKMLRSYYYAHRRKGQFPADHARDIANTEFSPGVRRMLALVGSECFSFD